MKHQRIAAALFFAVVLIGGFVAGRAHAAQPHMQAALGHLRNARTELNAAMADKGGHRAAAIRLVNDAIGQVEAGIEYARTH
jgi:carbohydrate-selective porin OprB